MASDGGARMNDAASQSQERIPEPDQLITRSERAVLDAHNARAISQRTKRIPEPWRRPGWTPQPAPAIDEEEARQQASEWLDSFTSSELALLAAPTLTPRRRKRRRAGCKRSAPAAPVQERSPSVPGA